VKLAGLIVVDVPVSRAGSEKRDLHIGVSFLG
jgi:hypothetical protein